MPPSNCERSPIGGPSAWTGAELEESGDWIWLLSDDDIAVLDEALVSVQARGLSWSLLTPANFPLGDFAAKADWLSEELENRRGSRLAG